MAQTREVVREHVEGVTPGGKSIVKETTAISSPEVDEKVAIWSVNRLVYYIAGVIEILLIFRFVLKILGANPVSPFVYFIYFLSGIFIAPFTGIFSTAVNPGFETVSVTEPATIVAIFVYLILAVGIVWLINILTATSNE